MLMSQLLDNIGWPKGDGQKGPIRVTCVGDSITSYGCASNDSMTYPSQLQRLLGPGYEVMNFGDSGKCMLKEGLCGSGGEPIPQCAGDCSYWHQDTFGNALHSSPDIVTIMLGTNDAKYCNFYSTEINGSPKGLGVLYREAYLDMIDMFRRLPTRPKIYVAVPPPLTHPPGHADQPPPFNMSSEVINGIYPILIRDIASDANVDGVIDSWSALGGVDMDPDLTCDGCHPKDEAFGIIAKVFAAAIGGGKRGEVQLDTH
jgi:acyl-CoA thioesterase-1